MLLNYSKKQFVMIAIFSLLGCGLYGQTNYYVSTSGNNNNSGTSTNQAWRTIGYAVGEASANSIINIRGGVYSESIYISSEFSNSMLTLQNYNGEGVTIDGDNDPQFWNEAIIRIENQNDIIIKGLV